MFGGRVMSFADEVAAIAAMRHSQMPVITASVDSFDFLYPILVGEAISVEAFVTWTGRTSMEVFVRASGEDLLQGERKITATSFLTMIATDRHGNPTPVPPVAPETEEQRLLFESAPGRHEQRRRRKKWHEENELPVYSPERTVQ